MPNENARGQAPRRKKARHPLRWLRRLLLLLGLFSVFSVVVLLAAYNFGSSGRARPPEPAAEPDGAGPLRSGQGFEFTQTLENEPVFRIRAARSREESDKTALLEEVELTLYRSDGNTYVVTSRKAIYNQQARHALLEGDVVMRGWQDLVVRTRALELRREGQIVESVGEVQFDYPPDLTGRATKMRFDFRDDSFILSEGVHLRSVDSAPEELRLSSERLSFQQEKRVIRAHNDVVVEREGDIVRAQTLSLFLREDQRTLESLRARFEVSGVLVEGEWPGPRLEARFRGENLVLLFDAEGEGARRVDLQGASAAEPAVLELEDETGLRRRLVGLEMNGLLAAGSLVEVESVGDPVTLVESVGGAASPFVLRHACARRIESDFGPGGELSRLELRGQVELGDRQLFLAGGDTATVDMATGSVRIAGKGGVELFDHRGSITAPRFDYRRDKGVIRAEGGVRTLLEESSATALEATPLGAGGGPLQIESETGIWTLEPATFSYRGGVRAWRGESLLLAEQLRGVNEERTLSATGRVRTVWRSAVAGGAAEPVEVSARQLVYDEAANALVYEGQVVVEQDSRRISCRELTVELGAGGRQAERMVCVEGVRVDDPASGRRLFGDRAVYTLARRVVEVFGSRVRLVDGEGNELEGRYLTYEIDTGAVQLKSSEPVSGEPSP